MLIATPIEKTHVFIPGGLHDGWVYDPINAILERLGKKCISLTLPGLEIETPVSPD